MRRGLAETERGDEAGTPWLWLGKQEACKQKGAVPGWAGVPDRGSRGTRDGRAEWQGFVHCFTKGKTKGLQRSESGPCGELWAVQWGTMWPGPGCSMGSSCPQRAQQGRETWRWLLCPLSGGWQSRPSVEVNLGRWGLPVSRVPGYSVPSAPAFHPHVHSGSALSSRSVFKSCLSLLLALCGQSPSRLSLCLPPADCTQDPMTCTKV